MLLKILVLFIVILGSLIKLYIVLNRCLKLLKKLMIGLERDV